MSTSEFWHIYTVVWTSPRWKESSSITPTIPLSPSAPHRQETCVLSLQFRLVQSVMAREGRLYFFLSNVSVPYFLFSPIALARTPSRFERRHLWHVFDFRRKHLVFHQPGWCQLHAQSIWHVKSTIKSGNSERSGIGGGPGDWNRIWWMNEWMPDPVGGRLPALKQRREVRRLPGVTQQEGMRLG